MWGLETIMNSSTDEDKIMWYTHTHNGISLSFKEKWNLAICNSMGRFWRYYAKWNISEWGRQLHYDFTHVEYEKLISKTKWIINMNKPNHNEHVDGIEL